MASDTSADRSPRDPTRVLLVLVLAAVVLSVGAIGYIVYDNSQEHSTSSSDPIEMDDLVTLDYIGMFADGRVFDTSIFGVASDDILYPKSLTFTLRGNDSYAPFEMTAGKYGVSGGTIKGFALGVLGLTIGDTETIEVLPEDGYAVDPAMLETIQVEQHINGIETMSESDFRTLFKVEPVEMDFVPHFNWQWDVLVIDVNYGLVTYKHVPEVGQTVYPFGNPSDDENPAGWACVVQSFDPAANNGSGEVVVKHMLSESDVYLVKGVTYAGEIFIISEFNATEGTFQIHRSNAETGYNGEISGRTLYFRVTIIDVNSSL